MSSQKIGPRSRDSCIMSWMGALARTDSMLPIMNLRGGLGMGCRGLSLTMLGPLGCLGGQKRSFLLVIGSQLSVPTACAVKTQASAGGESSLCRLKRVTA